MKIPLSKLSKWTPIFLQTKTNVMSRLFRPSITNRLFSSVIDIPTVSDENLTIKQMYSHVLDPNVAWTSYKSSRLQQIFPIAEANNIDTVFDYSIQHNLPEPFGVYTWESSYLMLESLEALVSSTASSSTTSLPINYHSPSKPEVLSNNGLHGLTVCDLCCGTGLTSMMAHRLGAKVIALDYNEFSLRLARLSFQEYQKTLSSTLTSTLESNIDFRIFDMANSDHALPHCDYLLLSDVLYSTDMARLVAKRVLEAIRSRFIKHIVITDPGREFSKYFMTLLNEEIQQDMELLSHFRNKDMSFEDFPHPLCKLGQRMMIQGLRKTDN